MKSAIITDTCFSQGSLLQITSRLGKLLRHVDIFGDGLVSDISRFLTVYWKNGCCVFMGTELLYFGEKLEEKWS